ncbi:hypothetical protein ADIS_0460 [Lunatimonas lonarensis]|uniref:Uncharacterized protein n=1 Tax=Lunatimonas lonarensis TaxID=1232681 RepID=R7ZYA9_9BACT|nr:hypothetical protein ADIS_0460 [Lunatimonas lonarensis]
MLFLVKIDQNPCIYQRRFHLPLFYYSVTSMLLKDLSPFLVI